MDLQMPDTLGRTPGALKSFVFKHIPGIKELLPKYRGLPGFQYFQCCVQNLRRAQDEGWTEVDNTFIYTIEGPKGSVDMKLLARGKRIPGQSHDSGARLCYCDTSVQPLTGLWINPHKHKELVVEEAIAETETVEEVQGPESGGKAV